MSQSKHSSVKQTTNPIHYYFNIHDVVPTMLCGMATKPNPNVDEYSVDLFLVVHGKPVEQRILLASALLPLGVQTPVQVNGIQETSLLAGERCYIVSMPDTDIHLTLTQNTQQSSGGANMLNLHLDGDLRPTWTLGAMDVSLIDPTFPA